MMEYFDIRDLNYLHSFRRALVAKLVAVRMQNEPVKHVCIDAQLLHQLSALQDEEIRIEPSTDGGPKRMLGMRLIGRAGMGQRVEVSSEDRKFFAEFEITLDTPS
jgi:hypothetical protein